MHSSRFPSVVIYQQKGTFSLFPYNMPQLWFFHLPSISLSGSTCCIKEGSCHSLIFIPTPLRAPSVHPSPNHASQQEPPTPLCLPLLPPSTPPQTVSSERSTLSPHATHSSFMEAAGKKATIWKRKRAIFHQNFRNISILKSCIYTWKKGASFVVFRLGLRP